MYVAVQTLQQRYPTVAVLFSKEIKTFPLTKQTIIQTKIKNQRENKKLSEQIQIKRKYLKMDLRNCQREKEDQFRLSLKL